MALQNLVKTVTRYIWQKAPVEIVALLKYLDDTNALVVVTQADVESVDYVIRSVVKTTEEEVATGSLEVADVIFDSLLTGDVWPYEEGANFRNLFAGDNFSEPEVDYYIDLTFTLVEALGGIPLKGQAHVHTLRHQS